MMCFRDKTFCSSTTCINAECGRRFGELEQVAAFQWWGGPGAPIAYADFETGCAIRKTYLPDTDTREG